MSDTPTDTNPIVEAVECYANDIYKIKYIVICAMIDEDDDPYVNAINKVGFFEVTEKPIPYNNCERTEWHISHEPFNVSATTSCCSKGFVEYVEKEIKNNKTDFPTTIRCSNMVWVILEITKMN